MSGLTDADREVLARVEFMTWMGMGESFNLNWADHLTPTVEAIVARHVRAAKAEAWDEGCDDGYRAGSDGFAARNPYLADPAP